MPRFTHPKCASARCTLLDAYTQRLGEPLKPSRVEHILS